MPYFELNEKPVADCGGSNVQADRACAHASPPLRPRRPALQLTTALHLFATGMTLPHVSVGGFWLQCTGLWAAFT